LDDADESVAISGDHTAAPSAVNDGTRTASGSNPSTAPASAAVGRVGSVDQSADPYATTDFSRVRVRAPIIVAITFMDLMFGVAALVRTLVDMTRSSHRLEMMLSGCCHVCICSLVSVALACIFMCTNLTRHLSRRCCSLSTTPHHALDLCCCSCYRLESYPSC